MKEREEKFRLALGAFKQDANNAAVAREAYRSRWAAAYSASDAKTEAGRKAEADIATSKERLNRDMKQIAADAALHALVFVRGPEVILDRTPEE